MNASLNKWIARILVVSMINPALFIQPAMARDTDVFSGFLASSTTTIKPNILLLLDTSDSMNLPESWREYPGDYDSHVEYLWNDLNRIVDVDAGTGGEIVADGESNTGISTAAASTTFFSKWGFWSGATLADRQALWQAARTSAKATETGDPGPRSQWRNYDDLSWIYWLPTGIAEADARLRSPSWNRFRGYIQELGNGTGGSQLRGGPTFADTNDYRNFNQCSLSLADLTPSTVFVPSAVAANSGKYLGQQWARWEPYLSLAAVGNSGYPGSSTLVAAFGGSDLYPRGYVDTTTPSTGNPANNIVYRDSYPKVIPTATPPNVGTQGLPIRYDNGSAGAGWDPVKADLGGFNLRDTIDGYSSQADLEQVMSWYTLPATTDVDASGGAADLADAKFIAWKGNRDASPAFGQTTGVSAYIDTTTASCDSATGPTNTNRTCLAKPVSSGTSDITVTKTATCALTGTTNETDVMGSTRKRGGACTISSGPTCTGDSNGTSPPNCSDVTDPVCPAATTSNSSFYTTDNYGCARGGLTTLSTGTTCALTGDLTLNVGGCSVTGASNVSVAACALTGATTDVVNACTWSGRLSKTVGACAWVGRTATFTEGVGWRATGGTCQEGGSTTYCAGVTDSSVYSTSAAAIAATGSCTNTAPAGTYAYGGTCTESGSAASCSISAGSAVLGGGYTNVNSTCTNSIAAGSYSYGGTCQENGSSSSCNAPAGGTSRTIRGSTHLYGQTCSNKANAGTTKNAVGTYPQGGTCAASQNNNVCTSGTGTSFIVRGTSYALTTCTATRATGTYHRGGACSGTNIPCTTVTPYGGTSIFVSPNTWYPTVMTCTPPTAAVSYYSTCTGNRKVISSIGGPIVTTTGIAASPTGPCSYTTHLAPDGNTAYDSCSNKGDVNPGCTSRYGVPCQTGCPAPTATSVTGGSSSATYNYFRTYNLSGKTDYLVHDCKADEPASNPGGNTYMRNIAGTLAPVSTAYSSAVSVSIASTAASYSTSSSQAVTADATKQVDMYSVNYLNWKFGPKGTTGAPIGRKTRLQIAKDVLSAVVGSISGVRIGLMSFNQMEKVSRDSSGSHLVRAVVDLDATTRANLQSSINALTASSATPLTESLYEGYLYFRGDTPLYGGSTYQALESVASTSSSLRYVTEGIDLSASAIVASKYKSPITETCQANAVILVSDGAPENDTSANTAILALPDDGTTSILQGTGSGQFEASPGLPYGPADSASAAAAPGNYVLLDELAFYMSKADARSDMLGTQSVKLNTVSFGVDAPVLAKAATVSGGVNYEASDAATLKAALEAAILSVSAWLPVGSTPATTINTATGTSGDIYLTAFSPSSNVAWPGTVKKYLYGFGTTSCGDASCGNPDVCLTGRASVTYGTCGNNIEYVDTDAVLGVELRKIRNEAVSLWIPAVPPDGGSGSKGGTAQVLVGNGDPPDTTRTPATRRLYTFLSGASSSATLSHADNAVVEANSLISKTLLGNPAMTDPQRQSLLWFAQGSDGISPTVWRTWPHYDSVHPAPIVDGSDGATLYYLTSDGVVHAVQNADGVERWVFMVEEGLAKIADFQTNAVGDHLEVADGSPMQVVTADGKRLLVFGMRRGGRAYYALDITEPNNPKFAWKITSSQICVGTTCTASSSYAELGQAWSTPVAGTVRGYKDGSSTPKFKPVLFFGGGYDTNQDAATPGLDTMGRAIFVTDAATGSLIRKFDAGDHANLLYSIPADVQAIDATGDRTIDRLYVGDMGGNLWRVDVDDRTAANAPSGWRIVRLANLATTTRPNKLFNQATVAPSSFNGQKFDAVFIGGGDTQSPNAIGANDSGAFFMVKDFNLTGMAVEASPVPNASSSAAPSSTFSSDFVDMTSETSDLEIRTGDSVSTIAAKTIAKATVRGSLTTAKGYVINLEDGEKVTSTSMVIGGELDFGTYFPRQTSASSSATVCVLGGYGKQYTIDALSSVPLRDKVTGALLYSGASGRGSGYRSGFGVGKTLVGGGYGASGGIYKNSPGLEGQPVGITGVRTFWYSTPEQ